MNVIYRASKTVRTKGGPPGASSGHRFGFGRSKMRVFMPGATEWLCHHCQNTFWWHPGESKATKPSECGCGSIKDPEVEQLGGQDDRAPLGESD